MRVPVRSLLRGQVHRADGRIVVTVSAVARRSALEQGLEVRQQQRFMFVDHHGGCGVKRLHVDDARSERRVGGQALKAVGQVDELGRMAGREGECRRDGRSTQA